MFTPQNIRQTLKNKEETRAATTNQQKCIIIDYEMVVNEFHYRLVGLQTARDTFTHCVICFENTHRRSTEQIVSQMTLCTYTM